MFDPDGPLDPAQLLLFDTTATVAASGTDAQGDPWAFGADQGEPVTTFEQDVPVNGVVTPIDFDADGIDDVGVSFLYRGASHGTRIDALLTENFAATPDTSVMVDGVEIPTFAMTGIDTMITKLPGGVVDYMAGLRLEVTIHLHYDDDTRRDIAYRTDDLDAPGDNEFPDATMFTFGVTDLGEGGFWPNDGYLLEAVEHSWDANDAPQPESYRPAIRDEIEVTSVDALDQATPLFRATTAWSAAPLPFAAGLYSVCDPMLPQDSAHSDLVEHRTDPDCGDDPVRHRCRHRRRQGHRRPRRGCARCDPCLHCPRAVGLDLPPRGDPRRPLVRGDPGARTPRTPARARWRPRRAPRWRRSRASIRCPSTHTSS